jgi:DNA-binding transcriptional MerR regulator
MFRIGDFSKFSRVSVRMLRHYDQLGLFKPARVDLATDYRYYSANQLPRLNRIRALQDIGLSLDQIAPLLEDQISVEEMRGMLLLKRSELQNSLEQGLQRLSQIEARLQQIEENETALAYDVVLRKTASIQVAAIRSNTEEASDLTDLFEELEIYVAGFGARLDQPPLAIFSADESGGLEEVIVAVPVKAALAETKRVKTLELPEIENMACVAHQGDYANIHLAGSALLRWIEANSYKVAGPMREIYYRFGAQQEGYQLPAAYLTDAETDFVTELQLPVERN